MNRFHCLTCQSYCFNFNYQAQVIAIYNIYSAYTFLLRNCCLATGNNYKKCRQILLETIGLYLHMVPISDPLSAQYDFAIFFSYFYWLLPKCKSTLLTSREFTADAPWLWSTNISAFVCKLSYYHSKFMVAPQNEVSIDTMKFFWK